MRKTVLATALVVVFLVVSGTSWALDIKGELTVPSGKLVKLDVGGVTPGKDTRIIWKVTGLTRDKDGKPLVADVERVPVLSEPDKDGNTKVIGQRLLFTGQPGEYRVDLRVIDFDKRIFDEADATITIGQLPNPPPPGPTPPGPTPPGPTPPPNPAPIPLDGLRVLMVEDVAKRRDVPPVQLNAMFSEQVENYLDTKCVSMEGSKVKEWRRWDKGTNASRQAKHWQDAMKRANDGIKNWKGAGSALPWIIVSNGKEGYEGPLPEDADKIVELIKKYEPK